MQMLMDVIVCAGPSRDNVKLDIAPLDICAPPAVSSRSLAALEAAKALSTLQGLDLNRSNIMVSPWSSCSSLPPG